MFETFLCNARWTLLIAVIGSMATAMATVMFRIASAKWSATADVMEREHPRADAVGHLVEVIDGFLLAIASPGEFDEFDLNAFFEATDTGGSAQFKHKGDVQKWLDIIRGGYAQKSVEHLKTGATAVPLFRCAPAALPATLILVFPAAS